MKPSHAPVLVPVLVPSSTSSAARSISSSSPPSPSNPPSPNSARDVPLLRLDQHRSSAAAAAQNPPPQATSTSSPVRRQATMHAAPSPSASSVSSSSSSTHPTTSKSTTLLQNNPRERKQSNPLRQFRSNASLGTSPSPTTPFKQNTTLVTSSRFGSAYLGTGPNPKGKDRYADAPEGGAATENAHGHGEGAGGGDEEEEEERDLMAKGRPGMRGRGESEGGFDEGWTNDRLQQQEEEEMGLLVGKKNAVWSRQGSAASAQRAPSFLIKTAQENTKPSKKSRTILFNSRGVSGAPKYPPNLVKNQKYNVLTFVPMVLYEQFKFFYNLYFLLVALSQFVPALRIGFLATYIVPLSFVLAVTISKEAFDEYKRYLRDASANATKYNVLVDAATSGRAYPNSHHASEAANEARSSSSAPLKPTPSAKLKVGDLVHLEKNERVPADILLLRTSDPSGSCFVRTDQLDGETDWKLRLAVERTQRLSNDAALLKIEAEVYADSPSKDIHNFVGTMTARIRSSGTESSMNEDEIDALEQGEGAQAEESIRTEPLTAENMLWANTVLAAGSAVGMAVYTGKETRAVMNTSQPGTKTGLLDDEINRLAKILCGCTFTLSVILVALNGFRGNWAIYVFRFLILFSSIIPISLRVNLDMGKTVYAHQIMNDSEIPETIVRTSTLPEELGRIEYLLSDKTGTLTQNEMELKKLHLGTMSYAVDSMDEVAHQLSMALGLTNEERRAGTTLTTGVALATRGRRDMSSRVKDVVLALALCHNVTPAVDDDGSITYQASSPDEVAIVRWTESVGLTLSNRDRTSMSLRTSTGQAFSFDILEVFPFTSESKRMGIVIRDRKTGEIFFYQKGADAVMAKIVVYNDWLEEECGNMAREGLRTLVMARKRLSEEAWARFDEAHREAKVALGDRAASIQRVIGEHLERDLELLGVTGVEDKLQDDVKMTIELLRNAGIKIWMLTGDKIETATCIAISTKLVSRNQFIHQVAKLKSPADARDELDFLRTKLDCCLVIDGESLQLCIEHFREDFIALSTKLSTVVACRCSPTQKADVARLIRAYTKKRVCCIGDGGNDVSMIQAADVGVGIVGKEGRQASLAADFSINQFSYLTKLLVWHGRNSYKRSAKLAQFVIHRGLIISVVQAVFSSVFYFSPIAIYQGWLMVGYATAYTMLPVFSLVLDRDVNEDVALLYPELYKELTKGRALSYKTFFTWLMISIYQGGTIMIASLVLFESEFLNIVSISFTALVLNELIMVGVEVTTWHTLMILSEVITLGLYVTSILFLPEYFDLNFVMSLPFIWKVGFIVAVSAAPLWIIKLLKGKFAPTQYAKLRDFAA
ncbi:phospholipid-translocating ATPase [Microbotryum lychnidis-dioicae p1A1 Lamole]|uniref:Phospholipid-transporting ATPase n=1 Tax=Microbotryum lychnidis-dioicae (strain p1A1 Lamole / MvSl-1064) TaxID=683840 RepID=U5HE09_USTV1|nr:phospholipid-translocating ATPase [Microbotryum lychnidis-dioicae p1A1 Lamole]|eukprot:KDE04200.1 phospholipid-translocating ATPase [Microbotryum lychnidis-dioicae p1A1 Lamole]